MGGKVVYIESDDEDPAEMDKQDMERDFSPLKAYDLDNSFDSIEVENKMILRMNTVK